MIYLAADHAGFELKAKLLKFIEDELKLEVKDMGAHTLDAQDDYPDFISQAARAVSVEGDQSRAIVLGGSGQGEAMAANRFKGVRAAVYYGGTQDIIRLSREHNNANVLSLAARLLTEKEAMQAVKLWLETPFPAEERHVRRIKKIDELI